jgi:hypothetical protein
MNIWSNEGTIPKYRKKESEDALVNEGHVKWCCQKRAVL